LDEARALQSARFVKGQMERYGYEACSLLLFGGEPLLNPEGALAVLRSLGSVGMSTASIITNGVLLDPTLARRLYDAGLRRAQITFDGVRETHDQIRVSRNGRGTYDSIIRNVRQAAEATGLAWHFRINVSHRNFDGLERLIDDISSAVPGSKAALGLALIDDSGIGYENEVGYSEKDAERFQSLNRYAIERGLTVPISRPLSSCSYCAATAGKTGAVINADGVLYSSWETAGRDEWAVGSLDEGYASDEILAPRWVQCDFDTKSHGSDEQARRFFDAIDAAALDSTHDVRLAARAGRP
jgi:uncharacterized protein